MNCAPEIFTFALQVIKSDAVVHFIMCWSWMALRWLLNYCVMSINALCAPVAAVSWIELMSFIPIATLNYHHARKPVTRISANHQAGSSLTHQDSWLAPDIDNDGMPDIEPDVEPDHRADIGSR
jgi:hypothetical protein